MYTSAHAWCSKHLPECMHTLHKKCTGTRACVPMQRCRNFFAMKAIANLSWVLYEHCVVQAVEQASFNHPRWCRPHLVCLWFALETWPRGSPHQKFYFRHFSRKFCTTLVTLILKLFFPDQCPLSRWVLDPPSPNFEPRSRENIFQGVQVLHYFIFFFCFSPFCLHQKPCQSEFKHKTCFCENRRF